MMQCLEIRQKEGGMYVGSHTRVLSAGCPQGLFYFLRVAPEFGLLFNQYGFRLREVTGELANSFFPTTEPYDF